MGNHPVLIGVGQWVDREATPTHCLNPLQALCNVALAAAADAGISAQQLQKLDAIGLMDVIAWKPQNGTDLVAESLGAHPATQITMGVGGDTPVALLNRFARDIAEGRSELALLAGTNHLRSLSQANRQKVDLAWPTGGRGAAEIIKVPQWGSSALERSYGLGEATTAYPLFENALRAERGLSLDEHINAMANLMSPFSRIAANNPYAWFPIERSAEEIATVTPTNRMIAYPYTKYVNAIINTEQAAAVLMCSVDMAKRLGIPEQQWVYWRGGDSQCEQIWYHSDRPSLTQCDAMGAAASNALLQADCSVKDVSAFDFYSCFPAVVEMACKQLSIAENDKRDFTVTGGLPYAGGPGSNYSLHAIAAMTQRLRSHSNSNTSSNSNNNSNNDSNNNSNNSGEKNSDHTGLITGNGWFMTKHAAAVLSTHEPTTGYIQQSHGSNDTNIPEEAKASQAANDNNATVATYTVTFGRDGAPERGVVLGTTEQGQRFLANTPADRELLESFSQAEQVGSRGKVSNRDGKNLFEPN